jgi:hypothetical protein
MSEQHTERPTGTGPLAGPGREADGNRAAEGQRQPHITPPPAGATPPPDTGSFADPDREAKEARAAREAAGPTPRTGEPGLGPDEGVGEAPDARGAGIRTEGAGTRTRAEAAGDDTTLLPHDEADRLGLRLRHAMGDFVDEPRHAVEEADAVLEEATAHVTAVLTERRRTLRSAWHGNDGKGDDGAQDAGRGDATARAGAQAGTQSETEDLRVALRQYRDLVERLLKV